MQEGIYIKAKCMWILLRKPLSPTGNPLIATDKLVYKEDKNRKSLVNYYKSTKINDLG